MLLWAHGILNGAQFGLIAESMPTPRSPYGLPFGATAWAWDYVILPAAELHDPIGKYDRQTLAKDHRAHLAYRLATAVAPRLLSR